MDRISLSHSNLAFLSSAVQLPLNTLAQSGSSTESLSSRPTPSIDAQDQGLSPHSNSANSSAAAQADEESPDASASSKEQERIEKRQALQDREEIRQLASRDREVRAHEQAHAAVGGQYAGAPNYDFKRGPDGVNYAVGGEVPIDTGRAATPVETIRKMQIVRRAALAPAEPSPQDRRVAAQATMIEAEARQELAAESIRATEKAKPEVDAEEDKPAADATGLAKTAKSEKNEAAPQGIGLSSRQGLQSFSSVALHSGRERSGTLLDQMA